MKIFDDHGTQVGELKERVTQAIDQLVSKPVAKEPAHTTCEKKDIIERLSSYHSMPKGKIQEDLHDAICEIEMLRSYAKPELPEWVTTHPNGISIGREHDGILKKPLGICAQCGKPVSLGRDGSCNNGHEICFSCWEKAGHNCPVCLLKKPKQTVRTLEQYLREAIGKNIIDFAVRAQRTEDDRIVFYIHPLDCSGETADFEVHGNNLEHNRDIKEIK